MFHFTVHKLVQIKVFAFHLMGFSERMPREHDFFETVTIEFVLSFSLAFRCPHTGRIEKGLAGYADGWYHQCGRTEQVLATGILAWRAEGPIRRCPAWCCCRACVWVYAWSVLVWFVVTITLLPSWSSCKHTFSVKGMRVTAQLFAFMLLLALCSNLVPTRPALTKFVITGSRVSGHFYSASYAVAFCGRMAGKAVGVPSVASHSAPKSAPPITLAELSLVSESYHNSPAAWKHAYSEILHLRTRDVQGRVVAGTLLDLTVTVVLLLAVCDQLS